MKRSSVVSQLLLKDEERELERLREPDMSKLVRVVGRCEEVAAVKRAAEASVGRFLRRHERMFP